MNKKSKLYTIGHSVHQTDYFIKLISMHNINAVCDVRSSPYSSYNPQYNREILKNSLNKENIEYIYLGNYLGPRSDDRSCYIDGKVSYERLSRTADFHKGIADLREKAASCSVALMCSEKDPIMCHRMILICRHLADDHEIYHILEQGSLERNEDSEKRLLQHLKLPEQNLFESYEEIVYNAYDMQAGKIAYKLKDDE